MIRCVLLALVLGLLCGGAAALFLFLLGHATSLRETQEQLVYVLPLAGLVLGWLYERYGESIKAGNNLVIDTFHEDGPPLPKRMAPMILLGTVLTHLFGGSAGREGTAIQMGASLSDALSSLLRLDKHLRRQLLVAGVAGGFGAVFGTPMAGVVFALEFFTLGRTSYVALLPALIAALLGDLTAQWLGTSHTHYPKPAELALGVSLLLKWLVFAVVVVLVTRVFLWATAVIRQHTSYFRFPLRMCLGGVVIVLLWQMIGSSDYLGLGVPVIVRSFEDPTLPSYAFAAKLLFTALTLGVGFLGGEVTPLFFVGAALGNLLATPLGIPLELSAAVGLAAVFAAAANTPLAISIMAVELFGAAVLPHVVIVCVFSYLLVGHWGIYSSQRVYESKTGEALSGVKSLREMS
jgi:H+/Cl- antiporter ClcA